MRIKMLQSFQGVETHEIFYAKDAIVDVPDLVGTQLVKDRRAIVFAGGDSKPEEQPTLQSEIQPEAQTRKETRQAMRTVYLNVTTDGSGDGNTIASNVLVGALYAVQLIDGDFSDGVDVTITCEQESLSIPLLVKADFNTDQMVYPRVAEALNTNGSALTTYAMPLINGKPKMVVAAGGAAHTGGCILYIVEM